MTHKRWLKCLTIIGGLLGMVSTTNAGGAPAPLQGQWAGERLILVIDAQGGRVESDCASGRFSGPVTASADGRFNAQGSFESHKPGPQRADVAVQPPAAARYSGELHDGVLQLSITPAGSDTPQVYRLQSGANIKLLRCL